MKKGYNYNYVFVMYDIAEEESEVGKYRVNRVFKICKKYLKPHQKSVFKGEITPAKLIKFIDELKQVIDDKLDYISIVKLPNENSFEHQELGTIQNSHDSMFL